MIEIEEFEQCADEVQAILRVSSDETRDRMIEAVCARAGLALSLLVGLGGTWRATFERESRFVLGRRGYGFPERVAGDRVWLRLWYMPASTLKDAAAPELPATEVMHTSPPCVSHSRRVDTAYAAVWDRRLAQMYARIRRPVIGDRVSVRVSHAATPDTVEEGIVLAVPSGTDAHAPLLVRLSDRPNSQFVWHDSVTVLPPLADVHGPYSPGQRVRYVGMNRRRRGQSGTIIELETAATKLGRIRQFFNVLWEDGKCSAFPVRDGQSLVLREAFLLRFEAGTVGDQVTFVGNVSSLRGRRGVITHVHPSVEAYYVVCLETSTEREAGLWCGPHELGSPCTCMVIGTTSHGVECPRGKKAAQLAERQRNRLAAKAITFPCGPLTRHASIELYSEAIANNIQFSVRVCSQHGSIVDRYAELQRRLAFGQSFEVLVRITGKVFPSAREVAQRVADITNFMRLADVDIQIEPVACVSDDAVEPRVSGNEAIYVLQAKAPLPDSATEYLAGDRPQREESTHINDTLILRRTGKAPAENLMLINVDERDSDPLPPGTDD